MISDPNHITPQMQNRLIERLTDSLRRKRTEIDQLRADNLKLQQDLSDAQAIIEANRRERQNEEIGQVRAMLARATDGQVHSDRRVQ